MSLDIQELLLLNCLIFNDKNPHKISAGEINSLSNLFLTLISNDCIPGCFALPCNVLEATQPMSILDVDSFNTFCSGMIRVL